MLTKKMIREKLIKILQEITENEYEIKNKEQESDALDRAS